MAELFDYMSWNIKQFSAKHAEKELIMGLAVKVWIAGFILDMEVNLLGIMEVTTATGAKGCDELKEAVAVVTGKRKGSQVWDLIVSDRSASSSKADKYALLYDTKKIAIPDYFIADFKLKWGGDRAPLCWQTKTTGSSPVTVNCMLWHAPQPKYHQGAATIKTIALAAGAFATQSKIMDFVVSGDFNYATDSTDVYAPLTSLSFSGIFDGQKTTLTTVKSFINKNSDQLVQNQKYDEAYLSSAYDNIFVRGVTFSYEWRAVIPAMVYKELMASTKFQIVTRSKAAEALAQAGKISDHLPVVITVNK